LLPTGGKADKHLLAERVSGFDQNQTLARKLTRLNYAKYSRIFARGAAGYRTEAVALRTSNPSSENRLPPLPNDTRLM